MKNEKINIIKSNDFIKIRKFWTKNPGDQIMEKDKKSKSRNDRRKWKQEKTIDCIILED